MIKILISETQKRNIEEIYWKWLSRYHLTEMLAVVENDSNFKKMIMYDENNKRVALKNFLLSDHNKLLQSKIRIDEMRAKNENIKESTGEYLKARYKNYRDSQAAKIVNALNMTVCPYCNQNHLNIVYEKDGEIRFWGDLDHFYDKSTYPEFAICLYNLIPVCKACNQLKSSQKSNIVSPYNHQIESNICFRTEFDDKLDLDYLQGKSQNFNIVIDKNQLSIEDKDEIKVFDLENRYKQLKQNVQEIIIKARAYDSVYQQQLKDEFGFSNDELDSYIFGYTENHLNRILSKFNMDIMNEFKY